MRRGAMPGQGGNVCDLVVRPAKGLVPDQDGRHFQVWEEPKINVIAGMAPMTGIQ
jgi:hypothetical protein